MIDVERVLLKDEIDLCEGDLMPLSPRCLLGLGLGEGT